VSRQMVFQGGLQASPYRRVSSRFNSKTTSLPGVRLRANFCLEISIFVIGIGLSMTGTRRRPCDIDRGDDG